MSRSRVEMPIFMAFIMVCTVFAAAGIMSIDQDEIGADAVPSRVALRYFEGTIGNLNNQTYNGTWDHEFDPAINAITNDGGIPPNTQTTIWNHVWLNETIWKFSIEIDIDADPHDETLPIDLSFTDWYGWNETGDGSVPILPTPEWYAGGADRVLQIGEGTVYDIQYTRGVFGEMNFTVYNGSSGEPLENVSFAFPEHPLHSTLVSMNATDENGTALFKEMQLGLDIDNKVEVQFQKEHFHMVGHELYTDYPLFLNSTSDCNYTMIEDPLVAGNLPLDGTESYPYVSQDKANIWIDFGDEMDPTSVSDSTLWIEDKDSIHQPVTYTWDSGNQKVTMNLQQDLDYNATYKIVADARIKNLTGNETLWRRFISEFTTILPPGSIHGTVLIDGTDEPAPPGTNIILESITGVTQELVDGNFSFQDLEDDITYRLNVIGPTVNSKDEYLYMGDKNVEVTVPRDTDKEITGLKIYKRETIDFTMDVMDEDGNPLSGAAATHSVTGVVRTSNDAGKLYFNESEGADVLANDTTSFKVNLLHYAEKTVNLPAGFDDIMMNITMIEEPLPIVVETFTSGEILDDNDIGILVDSTFHLKFTDDMNPETMSTDNIKIQGPSTATIPVTIESDVIGEVPNLKRWIVTPTNDLVYGTNYNLWVSDEVATQTGTNPLWKDLMIGFTTETLLSAGVSGRVEAMDIGVGGVIVKVIAGGEVLASAETDINGVYMMDVKMYKPQYFPVTIQADGIEFGLNVGSRYNQTLNSGGSINGTVIELLRLPGWFSYDLITDDNGLMPTNQVITLRFNRTLMPLETPGFQNNFSLLRNGALEVPISVNITEGGSTVQVKSVDPLLYHTQYVLEVSEFQDDELYKELRFIDGSKALIMGESIQVQTEFEPIRVSLRSPSDVNINNVSQDEKLNLYFSPYSVIPERVEEAIEVVRVLDFKPVANLTFVWASTDRALEIGHDAFDPVTEYMIRLPMGKYGANDGGLSAWIREDFEISFTTGTWEMTDLYVTENLPDEMKSGITTISVNNPTGFDINVQVMIVLHNSQGTPKHVTSFNLTPLQENKQIQLDLSDYSKGDYDLWFVVTDEKGNQLNEYPHYFSIEDESGPNGGINLTTIILIVIVVIIILFVVILAIFMFVQNKNRQEEEEIREEFECPECHNIVSVDDTVCPSCGAEFEEEAYKCPKCSAMLDPEDDECPECGYDFSDQDQMELEDDDDEDMDISDDFEAAEDEDLEMDIDEDSEEDMEEIEEEEEEED